MILFKKFISVAILLAGAFETSSAQKIINIPMPVVGNVPSAIAATGDGSVADISIHRNGTLAVATGDNELKVWTLPEGTLIYRFQRPLSGDPSNQRRDYGELRLVFTGDEKYMFAYLSKEVAETESGELLPEGALLDSVLNYTYDARRGYYANVQKIPNGLEKKLRDMKASPLAVKRDYSNWASDESIELIAVQRNPFDNNVLNLIYTQSHCGDNEWIRKTLKKEVKYVREQQKKDGKCEYYDTYWATYNLITGKAQILGRFSDSTVTDESNYYQPFSAKISPFGDVAVIRFAGPEALYSPNGRLLWKGALNEDVNFKYFDGVGNVVLMREATRGGKVTISVHDAVSGNSIVEYRLPGNLRKMKMRFVEQMGLFSYISKVADGNFTVTFHEPETGKMLFSLTDDEATEAFALKYATDAVMFAAQNEARQQAQQRSQQEAYLQSVADHNRAYNRDVAERNGSRTTTNTNACATCNGSGWEMTKGYLYNKTTREYSSGAGSGTVNYRVTSTPVYSNYESRQICSVCGGRGTKK